MDFVYFHLFVSVALQFFFHEHISKHSRVILFFFIEEVVVSLSGSNLCQSVCEWQF